MSSKTVTDKLPHSLDKPIENLNIPIAQQLNNEIWSSLPESNDVKIIESSAHTNNESSSLLPESNIVSNTDTNKSCSVDSSPLSGDRCSKENVESSVKVDIINTFADTLQLILLSSDLSKYPIQLNPQLVALLINVIKLNPNYFNEIEKKILVIVNNGKIDVSDVPTIIALLKDLYQILYNLNVQDIKKGLNISSCELILKFIVNVIFVDKIKSEQDRTELLNAINNIILLGVELITIRKVLKNNQSSLFSCFQK